MPELVISNSGWYQLEFRFPTFESVSYIPNHKLLTELFYPPSPEIIKSLPVLFGISDAKILNKVNKLQSHSWRSFCEIILEHREYSYDHNFMCLYHFASLNAYKEKHHFHNRTSAESANTLCKFSNEVMLNILVVLQQRIAEFEEIHQILQKNGLSASEYIYNFTLVHYCRSILPLPQRLTLNRKSAKQAIDLMYELPIETTTPTEYIADSKYWKNTFGSEYNLRTRFSAFEESLSYVKQLCENDEFKQVLQRLNYLLATEDRREHEKQLAESKKSKELGDYIPVPPIECLHQCEFCYSFYPKKLSKQSDTSRHCTNKACERHYDAWRKSLAIPLRGV